MKTTILALGLAALAIGSAASADPVNVRQLNQQRRIDAGVRSGKLTHHETARLKSQQAYIEQHEAHLRARHGGKLTAHDKAIIHAEQDQANRTILREKYNRHHGKNHLKI